MTTPLPLPAGLGWLHRLPSMALALADQAVVSGANFLHVIAAARCLSMEDFGVFSLAWAVLTFAGNIHQALVLQPLAVLYAEYAPGPARRYLHLLERFHVGLLLLILPALLAAWLLPAWSGLILATAVASLLRQTAEHERRVAYVLHDSPRALLIDIATYAPLACAAAWYWLHPQPISREMVMLAAALPAGLGWVVGRWLLRQARGTTTDAGQPVAPVGQHWGFGKWVLVSTLAMYASNQVYPFIVAGYLGLREVAALVAARSLIGMTHVVMAGVESYGAPRLRLAFVAGGWSALMDALRPIAGLFVLVLAPLLLVCAIWPDAIIAAVLNQEYREYAWVLRWISVVYVLLAITRLVSLCLTAVKDPRAGAVGYATTAVLTLITGPFVVGSWKLSGAIAALAVNALVLLVISLVWLILTHRTLTQTGTSTIVTSHGC